MYTVDPSITDLTDDDLAALAAGVQAEQATRAAEASRAAIQAQIDASPGLSDLGATALATDNGDPAWVVLEFPVDDLTGGDRAFAIGSLDQIVTNYSGQWVVMGKSVRNTRAMMESNLARMESLLTNPAPPVE